MSRAAAILAAMVTVTGPMTSPQPTESERQQLLAHLDMTSGWLIDEVTGLTDAQLRYRPAPDRWNIAQILEHLVVVGPIYWRDLQESLKQPAAGKSWMTDADVLWYGIDRTSRERAIAAELPPGESRDLGKALATYRTHHDRLRNYIKTTRDDLRGHIVERQRCDAYQWALLISTHEQRHILQIREVKAAPGFPKK